MNEVFFLAVAGALGTLSRYGLSGLAQRIGGVDFPFGTLIVNLIGSVLIGFFMQIGLNSEILSRTARLVITVGFLGAFTTFSTFGYETIKFAEEGAWTSALMNMAGNLVLGLLAVMVGMVLGRLVLARG